MRTSNKRHQPVHIYLDDKIYFLSVHIYDDLPLLNNPRKKELLNRLNQLFIEHNYKWYAYVILPNHYHLLFETKKGSNLSDILFKAHGGLSFKWNAEDNARGRTNFTNYWDYCPEGDKDFFTHFNYIHINPIKHKLVKNLEELKEYKYCSYKKWIEKLGKAEVNEIFERYPVVDYVVPND